MCDLAMGLKQLLNSKIKRKKKICAQIMILSKV